MNHTRPAGAKKVIPVGLRIKSRPVVLTTETAEQAVREASFVSLAHQCICRAERKCQNYSPGLGCLYLGEGARGIVAKGNAREITVGEGIDVVRQARELGLIHMILWTSGELRALGGDADHALELCSCCPCCCINRRTGDGMQAYIDGMTGLGIARADEGCTSCGDCERACYFKAIYIGEDGPEIYADRCKGCGKCEIACREGVLKVYPLEQVSIFDNGWEQIPSEEFLGQILKTIK